MPPLFRHVALPAGTPEGTASTSSSRRANAAIVTGAWNAHSRSKHDASVVTRVTTLLKNRRRTAR